MSSDSDISEEYFSNEEQEDTFDSKIRKKIRAKLNAKRNVNQGIMISEIHPEIITKYNSVEISYMNTHHLLIYVTKDGEENDRSWQTLKTLIELPIILVSESDAVRCVDELLTAKSLYYRIRNERIKQIIIFFSFILKENQFHFQLDIQLNVIINEKNGQRKCYSLLK